jgi:hypothetical protein
MQKVSEAFLIGERQLPEASIGLLYRNWRGPSQKEAPSTARHTAQGAPLDFFGFYKSAWQCTPPRDSSDLVVRHTSLLFA